MSPQVRTWRFVDHSAEDRRRRVVEVEVEQAEGWLIPSAEPFSGLHVRARYPLVRSRRWTRFTIVEPPADGETEAVEAVALHVLTR